MMAFEIGLGLVLIFASVVAILAAFANEAVVWFGVAIILAPLGAFSLDHGWHGENAKFHAKHAAIYRDVTRQGFAVKTNRVYARGGNVLIGTEVDIASGACLFSFQATKIAGTWRLTLPTPDGTAATTLSPASVQTITGACHA